MKTPIELRMLDRPSSVTARSTWTSCEKSERRKIGTAGLDYEADRVSIPCSMIQPFAAQSNH
jgi:hypothetical protein